MMCSTWRAAAVGLTAVAMIAANAPAARSDDEEGRLSGLSSFLLETEFEGWVAASYFYNFNDPDNPEPPLEDTDPQGGNNAIGNPVHANHHAFQFDEAWFVLDNAATEESPAGFHFEITYGATGSAIANDNPGGNDLWVPAAYVEYKTPIGPTITAGKFETTIGYEVLGAPLNVNVTRGFTYNLFQPIDHVGVKLSNEYDSGLSWALAAVNGFEAEQPEANKGKGFLWSLGYGTDMFSSSFNGIVLNPSSGTTYVLDLVLEANPVDQLLVWLNVDYANDEVGDRNPWSVGAAVGSRFAITDSIGIGGRFEYGRADDDGTGFYSIDIDNPAGGDGELDLYSGTVTIDWALVKNLVWKIEGQWQGARGDGDELFPKKDYLRENQFLLGTQLYYVF